MTETTEVSGSGKGPQGWFRLSHAVVYYDHPYFTPLEHTLNIDFSNAAGGPQARVAVELSRESARALIRSIEAALSAGESIQGQVAVQGTELARASSAGAR
ncbi:MAG: DUF6295 family protein [Candidatus Dormibacteraceae bacterium]